VGVGKEVRVIVCLARPAGGAGPRAGRILLVLILHRDPAWSRGDACLVVGREPSPMCLGVERKGMGHDDAPGCRLHTLLGEPKQGSRLCAEARHHRPQCIGLTRITYEVHHSGVYRSCHKKNEALVESAIRRRHCCT